MRVTLRSTRRWGWRRAASAASVKASSATALARLVGTPAPWLLAGGVVVQVKAEPAGELLEADRDAGLAGAHALKQGDLLGVGGRLLPLAPEQVAHPRGRLDPAVLPWRHDPTWRGSNGHQSTRVRTAAVQPPSC
jgi:hypothetical protein